MWYSVPLQLQRLFGVSLNLKVLTKNCINSYAVDKPMVINWPINSSFLQSDGSILCSQGLSQLTVVHTLLFQGTSPIQGVSHAISFLLAFPPNLVLISPSLEQTRPPISSFIFSSRRYEVLHYAVSLNLLQSTICFFVLLGPYKLPMPLLHFLWNTKSHTHTKQWNKIAVSYTLVFRVISL